MRTFSQKLNMAFLEILLLAIGLSMDSLAVSITSGAIPCVTHKKGLRLALVFGIFQGLMPLLGWLSGLAFKSMIENVDHWIAFGILLIIGGKMLVEAFKTKKEDHEFNINKWFILIGLAIATSIDAFIVGISLCFLDVNIWFTIAVIAVVTFLFSFSGVCIGKTTKWLSPRVAEVVGGIVLIGIGIKVLIEHNAFKL